MSGHSGSGSDGVGGAEGGEGEAGAGGAGGQRGVLANMSRDWNFPSVVATLSREGAGLSKSDNVIFCLGLCGLRSL